MNNLAFLRDAYLMNYMEDGITLNDIKSIENKLGIVLPDDFKQIATFFNGGEICGIENYPFYNEEDEYNIVDETLRLRKSIQLPQNYIVLAEPPESIILMDLECKPSIIWCDSYDIYNLISGDNLNNPDEWDSYSDFFKAMIENRI